MADLIMTLKAQHEALRSLVGRVDERLAADDLAGLQREVDAFRQALAEHLALEDRDLYPGLAAAAARSDDAQLKTVAAAFSGTMQNISDGLTKIFARYEQGIRSLEDFRRDWGTLKSVLGSRIRSEETSLYRLYARAHGLG